MSVLGDKIAANILAQTAEVPSIPWSGDGLKAELNEEGTIPDEIFNKACGWCNRPSSLDRHPSKAPYPGLFTTLIVL